MINDLSAQRKAVCSVIAERALGRTIAGVAIDADDADSESITIAFTDGSELVIGVGPDGSFVPEPTLADFTPEG